MDVILDANVILEDLAFERAQFGELFAYLRRTNSRIAIPTVVRDKVESRFREQLSKQTSVSKSAWEQIRELSGASNPPLPYVDIGGAMKLLRTRMQHPNPIDRLLSLQSFYMRRRTVGEAIQPVTAF